MLAGEGDGRAETFFYMVGPSEDTREMETPPKTQQ
jgi:hypothetical protein